MLSIIIPTLNEATSLIQTIEHTRRAACGWIEIIVSDCHSPDGTAKLAEQSSLVDHVVEDGRNRADALNGGAGVARGEVLLFLHADSLLPRGFDRVILRALQDSTITGGAFDFEFATVPDCSRLQRRLLDCVVLCNRFRYRYSGNFYGDQSIFVRRRAFERIGGFPDLPLMEDIEFSRRLQRVGRTAILRPPALTSPRRFLAHGVTRQFAEDLLLLGFHALDMRPELLWSRYNRLNRRAHGAVMPESQPLCGYVVLRHEGIPEPHFDLMIEAEPGGALLTFRTPVWPLEGRTRLVPLGEHRREYLTYEGIVSGSRGQVKRVAEGQIQWISRAPVESVLSIVDSEPQTWRLETMPDGTMLATRE